MSLDYFEILHVQCFVLTEVEKIEKVSQTAMMGSDEFTRRDPAGISGSVLRQKFPNVSSSDTQRID